MPTIVFIPTWKKKSTTFSLFKMKIVQRSMDFGVCHLYFCFFSTVKTNGLSQSLMSNAIFGMMKYRKPEKERGTRRRVLCNRNHSDLPYKSDSRRKIFVIIFDSGIKRARCNPFSEPESKRSSTCVLTRDHKRGLPGLQDSRTSSISHFESNIKLWDLF